MQKFEIDYAEMIAKVLNEGVDKVVRNGRTKSLFGMSLVVDDFINNFPVIQGRKMYPKGVFGEFAAMIRGPKHITDFTKWGCNFWNKWAKPDGSINIDYGNAWLDFNGVNQIMQLKYALVNNPNDRRMIISSWRPNVIPDLDLPCCHYSYQFHVANGKINMIWTQRSVDMMIGLPSDIIFAAIWLISLANEFFLQPGTIKMDFGDCHIYDEHKQGAMEYVQRVLEDDWKPLRVAGYYYKPARGADFTKFEPTDLILSLHDSLPPIKFELKA